MTQPFTIKCRVISVLFQKSSTGLLRITAPMNFEFVKKTDVDTGESYCNLDLQRLDGTPIRFKNRVDVTCVADTKTILLVKIKSSIK